MFESQKNVAVSASIFCLVVCVSDIMNKVRMCDTSVNYIAN